MGCKMQGAKKQGHYYSKREGAAWPLLILNNNDPVFIHPSFCNPYFGPFLHGHEPTHVFLNKNSRCRLTGGLGFRMQIINGYFLA